MVIVPVDVETHYKKRKVKTRSIFSVKEGILELYMDNEIIKTATYHDTRRRKQIVEEWYMWIRNVMQYHVFYIHIKPKEDE